MIEGLDSVRFIAHPRDDNAEALHPGDRHGWPHHHIIVEDSPFDIKQWVGSHIDRWHTPNKEVQHASQ